MWDVPDPGDIVWCRFPEHPSYVPGPKPRPVLVLTVSEFPETAVTVVYGTSQRVDQLFTGEFAIRSAENKVAFELAGLSRDTKFDLRRQITLPWNDSFFSVPRARLMGKRQSSAACICRRWVEPSRLQHEHCDERQQKGQPGAPHTVWRIKVGRQHADTDLRAWTSFPR